MEATVIDTLEAARILNTSPNVISNTIRAGRLPAMKVGRQWRIRRSVIEELLDRRADRKTTRTNVREKAVTPTA